VLVLVLALVWLLANISREAVKQVKKAAISQQRNNKAKCKYTRDRRIYFLTAYVVKHILLSNTNHVPF